MCFAIFIALFLKHLYLLWFFLVIIITIQLLINNNNNNVLLWKLLLLLLLIIISVRQGLTYCQGNISHFHFTFNILFYLHYILFQSWQLSEKIGMMMIWQCQCIWSWRNKSATLLLLLVIAVVVDYCYCCCCCCCKKVQELATANAYGVTVPWVFETYCCCTIAYKITCSRSIPVELGKVEGFRELWKHAARISSEYCQLYKCKGLSSLAACPAWTNQLVPSHLTLWITSVT